MNLFQSIILGVVEGFTEFLPVSSTAHLILVSKIIGLKSSDFLKTFEISIQLGAIASVVFLYWKTLIHDWELNKKILAALIPTALIGAIFYKLVKNVFLENYLVSIYALLIGGVVIILFEMLHKEKESYVGELRNISYKQAIVIGFFQSISIIPGVSRAAATIIGGLSMRIKREIIVEFSFLLAIPTMAAATGLDLIQNVDSFSGADLINLGTGFIVSFITATLSISLLLKYIKDHDFTYFGIYRIAIALLFLFLL